MKKNQRQLQKEMTRQHITEIALKQFAKTGLTTTKTSDIAKAANVSHGTIFSHFKTQEGLLNAVIEAAGTKINKRLHQLVSGKGSVYEVLEAHIAGLMEFEDFYTRLVIEGRFIPTEARNTLIMIQSTVSFHLNQAVDNEVELGKLAAMPNHMIFNGWIGLIHYYLSNNDLFAPGQSVLKRYGNELIIYYTNLLKGAKKKDE